MPPSAGDRAMSAAGPPAAGASPLAGAAPLRDLLQERGIVLRNYRPGQYTHLDCPQCHGGRCLPSFQCETNRASYPAAVFARDAAAPSCQRCKLVGRAPLLTTADDED